MHQFISTLNTILLFLVVYDISQLRQEIGGPESLSSDICEVLQSEPVAALDGRPCYVVRQNGRMALVPVNQFSEDYNGERFVHAIYPVPDRREGLPLYKVAQQSL